MSATFPASGQNRILKPCTTKERLKLAADRAANSNPLINGVYSGVTVTVSSTHNAALTNLVPAASASGLLPAASYFRFHRGTAYPMVSQPWVLFPVASVLPSTSGNLSGYLPTGMKDRNGWTWEAEFSTDAETVEVNVLPTGNSNIQIQIDEQYATSAAIVPAAYSGSQFISCAFTSRLPRRFRVRGTQASGFGGVNILPTESIWTQNNLPELLIAVTGDSYSEGQGVTSPYDPDAAWCVQLGLRLGLTDIRQVAVGGTGYVNTGGGRSNIYQQINNWGFAPDVIISAAGSNDSGYTAQQITAEALLAFTTFRSIAPLAPIFVLGAWGENTGPSSAIIASENAVMAAFDQFNDPNSWFIPISTNEGSQSAVLFGTGTTSAPNGTGNADFYITTPPHPNNLGHAYLGKRVAYEMKRIIDGM